MPTKMYQFTPTAAAALGEAGITQAQIAERSGYDRHELNKRLHRRGVVRHASASRIAQAFAELAHTTKDRAMQVLFNEITEDAEPQRTALKGSATRGERP